MITYCYLLLFYLKIDSFEFMIYIMTDYFLKSKSMCSPYIFIIVMFSRLGIYTMMYCARYTVL